MFRRFFPGEDSFFSMFTSMGDLLVESCTEFRTLLADPRKAELTCHHLSDIESRADSITHSTVQLLHRTFITPFDRDDIHALITSLDEIIDLIEAAGHRFLMFEITEVTQEMRELAQIFTEASLKVKEALGLLSNLKNPEQLMQICVEINRLENDSDRIYRRSLSKIFREEKDPRKLIILKEVYSIFESVTDACEEVANLIEGIILDYT